MIFSCDSPDDELLGQGLPKRRKESEKIGFWKLSFLIIKVYSIHEY